jgi:hypothetical protein
MKGRLSKVGFLVKVACFFNKRNIFFQYKWELIWTQLVQGGQSYWSFLLVWISWAGSECLHACPISFVQWIRISHKHIDWWQHLSWLKASAFCSYRSKVKLVLDRLRKQSRILPDPRGLVREGGRVRQDSPLLHRRPHEEPPGVTRLDSSLTLRQIKLWPLL